MSTVNDSATEPGFWAAPDLAKAGYPVFPVNGDKRPSVEGGFYAATTDVSQVAEWIIEGREHHDVAFATGIISGVVVLDADTPEAVARMEADYGEPTVRTRRGAARAAGGVPQRDDHEFRRRGHELTGGGAREGR
jgi:hypothetical protein